MKSYIDIKQSEKVAEAYADNREISMQDGAGYPFKEEIMRAFIVGAAWREHNPNGREFEHVRYNVSFQACLWISRHFGDYYEKNGYRLNDMLRDLQIYLDKEDGNQQDS